MIIKIRDFDCSEVWDGVFYKKLSNYPSVTPFEIRNIIEFIEYEKLHGRSCTIECEDRRLLDEINEKLGEREKYINSPPPRLLTECTACLDRGCRTDLVCHTTSLENAIKIFRCGSLLSATKARGIPADELMKESRNAANDPVDYFDYIMFAWGNCQGGDRLVTERNLGRFPNEDDLGVNFKPGIRFYFEYERLASHPNRVFDGVLPMKVKDEVKLCDWVYKIVIPEAVKEKLADFIPENLQSKVVYIKNDCKDIWEWSRKVYMTVKERKNDI